MSSKSERFELRLDSDLLDRLDAWRDEQTGSTTRAEAMRTLVEAGLERANQPQFSDGERLITHLLCDVIKHLDVKTDFDADFITSALSGGHYWAFDWEYQGTFHRHADTRTAVTEVVDILDMWSFVEEGYEALSAGDKAKVNEQSRFSDGPQFYGFDGNNETEYMGISRFLTEKMGRFERFADRGGLNAHSRTLQGYRRMLNIFNPVRATVVGRKLSASEIVSIVNA